MKLLLSFTCLLTLSCNTGQPDNVEKPKIHSDTSSLFYEGKPLFVFNETFDNLSSRLNFYQDTTNRQGGGFSYITLDTFLSARQSTGTMIGTLLIETDNLRQIQKVYGHWAISVQMNDKTKQEAIDSIKNKFFPIMSQKFVQTNTDTIRHKSFIEEFKFYASPDSGDIDHGYVPHWSFVYEAKRTKNGL